MTSESDVEQLKSKGHEAMIFIRLIGLNHQFLDSPAI